MVIVALACAGHVQWVRKIKLDGEIRLCVFSHAPTKLKVLLVNRATWNQIYIQDITVDIREVGGPNHFLRKENPDLTLVVRRD